MKVLELYSGIGGMHYALKESAIGGEIVLSVDINTVANEVYRYNFPKTCNVNKNIQSLDMNELRKLNIDMILMSPPCQPFTRVGLKKDNADNRSESLFHVLKLIPQLETLKYILLENVKGFESSEMRKKLITCLEGKYNYKELLLSPCQFGIPNSRYRYYLLVKRKDMKFCFDNSALINYLSEEILKILPVSLHRLMALEDVSSNTISNIECYKLHHILEEEVEDKYLVPEKVLLKYGKILDIRNEDSNGSCCFTKAYAHYVEGTGSVLCSFTSDLIKEKFSKLKSSKSISEEELQLLFDLKLRYFTPKEVSKLMCFPDEFSFPNTVSDKQKYRLLGNSINVHVVSQLIFLLNYEKG